MRQIEPRIINSFAIGQTLLQDKKPLLESVMVKVETPSPHWEGLRQRVRVTNLACKCHISHLGTVNGVVASHRLCFALLLRGF